MNTLKSGQRKAKKFAVIAAISENWCIGRDWHRDTWVAWLKGKGLLSPRTNPQDCLTVGATIHRLKTDDLRNTVFGQPAELKAKALEKERDRLLKSALQNAAERDALKDVVLDLKSALDWIADGHDDKEGMDLIVRPLRAKYNLANDQEEPRRK